MALALDGKFIRETVGLVTLAEHETGAPVARIAASQKKGDGEHGELKAAQNLICQQKDLTNTVITADALNTQQATAQAIVERGRDHCIQVKDNQKAIHLSEPMNRRAPAQWLDLTRGHWGAVEIRNHWRKDACLLEDKTRSRNPRRVGALAMLRYLLVFMHKEEEPDATLPGFVEGIAADQRKAFSMLMRR